MSKNTETTDKLLAIYRYFKQKKILKLDAKKKSLQSKLKSESEKFHKILSIKEELTQKSEECDRTYDYLLNILKSRGAFLNIPNNSFQVREWDNLFIKHREGLYLLVSKRGEFLYAFEKKYNHTLQYILNKYSYSIVVVRKDVDFIKIQFRILEGYLDGG